MGRDRVKLVKFPVENDQTITSSIDGYLMGYCVGLCGRLFSIIRSFRSLIGHKRSVSRTSMLASARPRERLVSIVSTRAAWVTRARVTCKVYACLQRSNHLARTLGSRTPGQSPSA